MGDYLITEAGFGADLGAEKFFDIKCRLSGLKPDAVVIVATIRSLKYNGGVALDDVKKENLAALEKGAANLEKHIENIKKFGVPAVVAVNVFPDDTASEIELVKNICEKLGAEMAVSRVWAEGGRGGKELAVAVLKSFKKKSKFRPIYDTKKSIKEKINIIAKVIYGAREVKFSVAALEEIKKIEKNKLDKVPVCIAKTQYSLTDDPKVLGRPKDFTISISEIRISNGAGFIVAIAGDIMTMPGLPKVPAAEKIDIGKNGKISGLF